MSCTLQLSDESYLSLYCLRRHCKCSRLSTIYLYRLAGSIVLMLIPIHKKRANHCTFRATIWLLYIPHLFRILTTIENKRNNDLFRQCIIEDFIVSLDKIPEFDR